MITFLLCCIVLYLLFKLGKQAEHTNRRADQAPVGHMTASVHGNHIPLRCPNCGRGM